jgi:F-type H+-transporting ATPase subunit b
LITTNLFFAEETSSSGISSLGINLKGFLFQLITFVIVLLILRRWVFPRLVATIEARRKTLEESLAQAKQTEDTLAKAEEKVEAMLARARTQADQAMADAKTRADEIIAAGEKSAEERGARIITEAEARLDQERQRLHTELKSELAELVVETTEKVLRKKMNEREDRSLIEQSLKEIG